MFFKVFGFVVTALIAVGVIKWGWGVFQGYATPEQAPNYINREFNDVGVGVVPGGGGSGGGSYRDPYGGYPGDPEPYRDLPQGTAPLDQQLGTGR
jgi:hypothetical protein